MNSLRAQLKTKRRSSSSSNTRICIGTIAVIALFGCLGTIHENDPHRTLLNETDDASTTTTFIKGPAPPRPPTFMDEDGVCVNALPYAKLHDGRPDEVEHYKMKLTEFAGGDIRGAMRDGFETPTQSVDAVFAQRIEASSKSSSSSESNLPPFDKEAPEYVVLPPGSSVAYWDCSPIHSNAKLRQCTNPRVNGKNIIKGSAWTSDGIDAFPQEREYDDKMSMKEDHSRIWVPHDEYDFVNEATTSKQTMIQGDAVAFFGFFPINFGHVLHDNLPMIAWLRSIVPIDTTTFLLPDTDMYRKLLDFIDPTFLDHVYFFQPNEIVTVEDGTLTVSKPTSIFLSEYGNTLFRHLRHWIYEHHSEHYPNQEDQYVVFHTRAGPHTAHGRLLEAQHEQVVLDIIREKMEYYGRTEQLVIFSGQDDQGNILPLDEQYDIFRHASTIIGPHGSGLANNIWTYPFPTDCNQRVKMLEFIPATDSDTVQSMYNGYYWVMRGMPIEWHQVLYTSDSTIETTFIHLEAFIEALDDMWGPLELSSSSSPDNLNNVGMEAE